MFCVKINSTYHKLKDGIELIYYLKKNSIRIFYLSLCDLLAVNDPVPATKSSSPI